MPKDSSICTVYQYNLLLFDVPECFGTYIYWNIPYILPYTVYWNVRYIEWNAPQDAQVYAGLGNHSFALRSFAIKKKSDKEQFALLLFSKRARESDLLFRFTKRASVRANHSFFTFLLF